MSSCTISELVPTILSSDCQTSTYCLPFLRVCPVSDTLDEVSFAFTFLKPSLGLSCAWVVSRDSGFALNSYYLCFELAGFGRRQVTDPLLGQDSSDFKLQTLLWSSSDELYSLMYYHASSFSIAFACHGRYAPIADHSSTTLSIGWNGSTYHHHFGEVLSR